LERHGVTVAAGAPVTLISTQGVQSKTVALASSVVAAVATGTIVGGGIAVLAGRAAVADTVQKVAMALAAATTLGVTLYQTQEVRRLEREPAAARQRSDAWAEIEAGRRDASTSDSQSPNAAWAAFETERDRLIPLRDAAERLARL
jgi:hypothetical protein